MRKLQLLAPHLLGLRVTFEFPDGRYDEIEVPANKIDRFMRTISDALEDEGQALT